MKIRAMMEYEIDGELPENYLDLISENPPESIIGDDYAILFDGWELEVMK